MHLSVPLSDHANLSDRFLGHRVLIAEPLHQKLADCLPVRIIRVQRVRSMYITMPECSTRQPLAVRFIDDPVPRTFIRAPRPPLNHVPAVNDVYVFQRGDVNPLLPTLMPHLQAVLARLLEQDCDAAEVGMGPDADLTRKTGALWGIADHLHGDDRPLGKFLHQGWRLAEALEQDHPDGNAELAGLFVVRPDWTAEVVF